MKLLPASRLLLWDYGRGSLPYDVLCVALLLFLFLVPRVWLGDPMVTGP
jgi:hypothetical protein